MNKNRQKQGGYIMTLNTLLFIAIMMLILFAIAQSVTAKLASSRSFKYSKQAYMNSNSLAEEVLYRLKSGKKLGSSLTMDFEPGTVTADISNDSNGKEFFIDARLDEYIRKLNIKLAYGTGISFHYGIQSGKGGFVLQNTSSVIGNVFSDGSITGSGNYIYGDVISAGEDGLIDGIHATGTAYAHNLRKTGSGQTIIEKDAFYTNKDSGVIVNGALHPGSPDQQPVDLPISDAQIAQWENDAAAGGSVTCTNGKYLIDSDVTIGPVKVPCDLEIQGSSGGITVTVSGPIWVEGNIETTLKSLVRMDPALGSDNVAIIAHDPNNQTTSGLINIAQNVSFQGSGAEGSFVFLISQNSSAENGGNLNAFTMNNGASAAVAYAPHGQVLVSQSAKLREITAYKIILKNSASVTYDKGLPSVLFQAGPGGGYDLIQWLEI